MESEQIISEVKKRPVIWDSTEECYKNKNMKMDAWMDVAASIEPTFRNMTEAEQKLVLHDISMKWRSIRDNYVRYKKKMSETSSRNGGTFDGKPLRSYVHAKQLRFLNKSLMKEAAAATPPTSPPPTSPPPSAITDFIDPMELVQTQVFALETIPDFPKIETEDVNTTTCSYSLPPKIPRPANYVKQMRPSGATINTNTSPSTSMLSSSSLAPLPLSLEEKLSKFMEDHKAKAIDEDLSFFESMLPTIKLLNNDEKLEFRIRTLQLLQDIKRKHDNLPPAENVTTYDYVSIKQEI
ncbi:uncharacterized protein LOC106086549 [Stomoxys calcitrans]|uniref:MADF domain-containing protein n=1 Tax=Stomoxys calcitrans TaxID=35570 RepID=A0A1I8P5F8_STOCA|nr:uncharacterized protein LOC106086549 [Stomoxys calcitrans]